MLWFVLACVFVRLSVPAGYQNTFVCEPDEHKALEMYKEWKYGKK